MPKKSTGYRYPEQFKAEAVHLAYFSPEKSIRQLAYFNRASRITDLTQLGQASPVDRGEREDLSSEER